MVLDAESVGSMGLPIILVSKVTDKAEKINDQTEWTQVKGYLKNIISGGPTNYLTIPESLSADETYYTQLTLPVASFDALKSYYAAPADNNADVAPTNDGDTGMGTPAVAEVLPDANNGDSGAANADAAPAVETPEIPPVVATPAPAADMQPVNMSTDVPQEEINPVVPEEPAESTEPVIPTENLVSEEAPANNDAEAMIENPVIAEEPSVVEAAPVRDPAAAEEATVIDTPQIESVEQEAVAPVEDMVAPVASAVADGVAPTDAKNLDEIKQRFLTACEDLFDYLSSMK